MEGPLLVLKSWLMTAVAIWVYRRWFQRVAPPSPDFEAFCAGGPVVAVVSGVAGNEREVAAALGRALGGRGFSVATLGGFPWPHYRLTLTIEQLQGAVLLRVQAAEVLRSNERQLPALASLVRDVLNSLPDDAQAWLHPGVFNNGLVEVPPGGWALERGEQKHPRLRALHVLPEVVLGSGHPGAAVMAVHDDAVRLRSQRGGACDGLGGVHIGGDARELLADPFHRISAQG